MLLSLARLAKAALFYLLIPIYVVVAPTLILMVVLGLGIIVTTTGTMVVSAQPNWPYIGAGFAVLAAAFILLTAVDRLYRWTSQN